VAGLPLYTAFIHYARLLSLNSFEQMQVELVLAGKLEALLLDEGMTSSDLS